VSGIRTSLLYGLSWFWIGGQSGATQGAAEFYIPGPKGEEQGATSAGSGTIIGTEATRRMEENLFGRFAALITQQAGNSFGKNWISGWVG
jgi:hypothetical protein